MKNKEFWVLGEKLISESRIVIDRPKGSTHPVYANVYPVDYGYLENTYSMDKMEIDLWKGSLKETCLVGIVSIIDYKKREAEIKLLVSCSDEEIEQIESFTNQFAGMKGIVEKRT